MKCELCGQENFDDFTTCPSCNSWNPEINRIETRIYYILGYGVAAVLLLLWRAKGVSSQGIELEAVLTDPISLLLLLVVVALIVAGGVIGSRLRKLRT